MTEPWPVHTLVFDLDDTLYPERDFVLSGFQAVDKWLRKKRKVAGFASAARQLFEQGRRGNTFDEVFPLIGLEPAPGLVAQLVEIYRGHEPELALFPDAAEVLGWAAPRFNLALLTDGYAAVQARKIRALGLEDRISCRIITDELGREFWKPSPEPYRRVMTQYPGPTAGYLYVGDNAHKDFLGARSLGWRTVRIHRPLGEHAAYSGEPAEAAEHEIESLLDLRGLITFKRSPIR